MAGNCKYEDDGTNTNLVDPRFADQNRSDFANRGPNAIERQIEGFRLLLESNKRGLIEHADCVIVTAQTLAKLLAEIVRSSADPSKSSVDVVATVQQWMNAPLQRKEPEVVYVHVQETEPTPSDQIS